MVERRVMIDDGREAVDRAIGFGRQDVARLLPDDALAIVERPGKIERPPAGDRELRGAISQYREQQDDGCLARSRGPVAVGHGGDGGAAHAFGLATKSICLPIGLTGEAR